MRKVYELIAIFAFISVGLTASIAFAGVDAAGAGIDPLQLAML
jgi:hypothetical protein